VGSTTARSTIDMWLVKARWYSAHGVAGTVAMDTDIYIRNHKDTGINGQHTGSEFSSPGQVYSESKAHRVSV